MKKIITPHATVTKVLTGIQGFDEITDGGLPRGRTTLVMGGPGCGKTVFALQSLVNVAHRKKEASISSRSRRVRGRSSPTQRRSGGIFRGSRRRSCFF